MAVKETLVFLFGFISCAVLVLGLFYVFEEVPFGTGMSVDESEFYSDFVSEDDILVRQDYIIIKIEGVSISSYAPTGSMLPLIHSGANGIRIVPSNVDDIGIGDIVSFDVGGFLVVHRVVEKGVDSEGIYFVTRGENNFTGEGKIRFEDIKYVTVGVLW